MRLLLTIGFYGLIGSGTLSAASFYYHFVPDSENHGAGPTPVCSGRVSSSGFVTTLQLSGCASGSHPLIPSTYTFTLTEEPMSVWFSGGAYPRYDTAGGLWDFDLMVNAAYSGTITPTGGSGPGVMTIHISCGGDRVFFGQWQIDGSGGNCPWPCQLLY
jgi:hypothetical protein